MRKHMKLKLASACLAALTSATVLAQTPNAPQPPRPQAGRPAHERAFARPTERVEAQLAYQKTAIKITPAQEAQWNAYAEFTRKQARDTEQRFSQMRDQMRAQRDAARNSATPPQRPNAVQRLERQQAFLAEASRNLNERLAVQKPLYAALSPEQQKVADVVLNPRGGMERGGRGHMSGRRDGGHMGDGGHMRG